MTNGLKLLQQRLTHDDGFSVQARALAATLRAQHAQTLAVYTRNATTMQLALAAAALGGCRLLLPSTTAAKTLAWCDAQCDFWYGDDLAVSKPYLQATSATTDAAPDNIDILLMSSGSSGAAKSLTIPLAALCDEATACAALFPEDPAEIHSSANLQHRYGLLFHAVLPLLKGWTVVADVYDMPEAMLGNARDNVWWVTSPTFLHHLGAQRDLTQWQGNISGILSAGGALSADLKAHIERTLHTTIRDIYGSSETGAIACRQHDHFHWLAAVSGNISAEQTTITAPWLDGTTALGDRLQAQPDGGFILLGRQDSIVKLADKRVDLAQVAALIRADARVNDLHIAVHPEHRHLFAWVALNEQGIRDLRRHGRQAIAAQLREWVSADQPRIAVPRFWRFEVALPRNEQAKLTHEQVRSAMLDAPLAPSWTCVAADDQQAHYQGRVPLDLLYVRGHFTHCGIVPGVVELKWVRALASAWLGRSIDTQLVENLKFRKLLRPYDPLDVRIHWNAQRSKLLFTCENHSGVVASGRIVPHD